LTADTDVDFTGIVVAGTSDENEHKFFIARRIGMTPDSIIDLNKTSEGEESLIIGQNTAVELDALKAVAVLKNKIRRKNPERTKRTSSSGRGNHSRFFETLLFPREPAGYAGGKSIMDRSNNVQIVITPNEYRDGVLHALFLFSHSI
jgi:hypothetical protein